jgi:hypothetical protein
VVTRKKIRSWKTISGREAEGISISPRSLLLLKAISFLSILFV